MSFPTRYATLLDGDFLLRKMTHELGRFPTAAEIEAVANTIDSHECVAGLERLRVYFYHAQPATAVLTHPLSKQRLDLAKTAVHARHTSLLAELETTRDFALRLGETSTTGRKLGVQAFRDLMRTRRLIEPEDLVPAVEQKGVDLRIGLDIARLALKESVQAIVAVTGDSDLVPAFKFARREGLRVFLCHFDHRVKRELRAHADRVIDLSLAECLGACRQLRAA